MNNSLEYRAPAGAVPEYMKKMLTVIPDGVFLPVSIIGEGKEESSVTVVSDATGFIPLKDAGNMLTAERVYAWLEKLLRALISMSEYLINPADLVLTGDTVFVGAKGGDDVRILLSPLKNEGKKDKINITLNSIIKEILIEIDAEDISRDLHSYIGATIALTERNCSVSELYAHIIKLRREAKLCGIE